MANIVKKVVNGLSPEDCDEDNERMVNLLFIQDCCVWELFNYGIKHGDIGLIKASIPYLAMLFSRAGKHLYTLEILYLKRLIDSDFAKTPEVQLSVASTLLVNPTGREDGWYPLDLSVEFLNRNVKAQWSTRRTSALSPQQLSEYCTLNSIYFTKLRGVFGVMWGRNVMGRHPHINRGRVLRLLAKNLHRTMGFDATRATKDIPGVSTSAEHAYSKMRKALKTLADKFEYSAHADSSNDEDDVEPATLADSAFFGEGISYDENGAEAFIEALDGCFDDTGASFDEVGDWDGE